MKRRCVLRAVQKLFVHIRMPSQLAQAGPGVSGHSSGSTQHVPTAIVVPAVPVVDAQPSMPHTPVGHWPGPPHFSGVQAWVAATPATFRVQSFQ